MKKVRLLQMTQAFDLVLPLVSILWILIDLYLNRSSLASISLFSKRVLVDVLFLNVTHNAFTLGLLSSSPTFKLWINNRGGERKFWRGLILMTLVGSFFLFLLFYFRSYDEHILVIFFTLNFLFPVHHALAQSFGLSRVYNRGNIAVDSLERFEKYERLFFNVFLVLTLVSGLFFLFITTHMLTITPHLSVLVSRLTTTLLLVIAFIILAQTIFYVGKRSPAKIIFSFRYFVWSLVLVSPVAIYATYAIHGVEYWAVTQKMISREKNMKLKALVVLTIGIALLAVPRSYGIVALTNNELPIWILILTSISVAISFVHIYLDRQLFKMRVAINRETIGSLLKETA